MPRNKSHSHSPSAIRHRLSEAPRHSYLRDWVYGGIDGSVTSFAVVAGVTGGQLSTQTILILGLANLLADGFSMAASNYLGTRTEIGEINRMRAIEVEHIEQFPEGEKEEIRQLYEKKGFSGELLEQVVKKITSDRDVWLDEMLSLEYHLPRSTRSPVFAGLATFFAFFVCGAIPLIPFTFQLPNAFFLAGAVTACVFFGIGAMKSFWALTPWWRSGLETLFVGGTAAALAYGAGVWIQSILN